MPEFEGLSWSQAKEIQAQFVTVDGILNSHLFRNLFSSSLLFLNKREPCELIHLLGFPPQLKWISVFVLGIAAVHGD